MIPLDREVTGLRIDLFSPYYLCNAPRAVYEVKCRVYPQKSDSSISVNFTIVPKLVRFPAGYTNCGDYLYFRKDNSKKLQRFYCNYHGTGIETWNDAAMVVFAYDYFEINYKIENNGVGGKFWLQIEANVDQVPVWLDVMCTGQENIPVQPASCLPSTTISTTTAKMTTTTTPTTTTSTTSVRGNSSETTDGDKPENGSSNTLLMGVLGGVIALVLIVACVAVFLFCVVRKKNRKKAQQKKVPPITPPRRPRPKSIQKITAFMKGKGKAPSPDEESAIEAKQMENNYERDVKATKPTPKPPRPSSIQKMAALLKSKKKAPAPPKVKPTAVKEENVAVVQPVQLYATVDKKNKKGANNEASEEAEVVDSTHTYAVPNKKKSKPHKYEELTHKDADETVMFDNDDLYSPANEDVKGENDKNNEDEDMYENVNAHKTDNVIEDFENDNNVGHDDPNLYANVQSRSDEEDFLDESRESVMLPENYQNEPYSRTSIV